MPPDAAIKPLLRRMARELRESGHWRGHERLRGARPGRGRNRHGIACWLILFVKRVDRSKNPGRQPSPVCLANRLRSV